jgi:hypothetical protein
MAAQSMMPIASVDRYAIDQLWLYIENPEVFLIANRKNLP